MFLVLLLQWRTRILLSPLLPVESLLLPRLFSTKSLNISYKWPIYAIWHEGLQLNFQSLWFITLLVENFMKCSTLCNLYRYPPSTHKAHTGLITTSHANACTPIHIHLNYLSSNWTQTWCVLVHKGFSQIYSVCFHAAKLLCYLEASCDRGCVYVYFSNPAAVNPSMHA